MAIENNQNLGLFNGVEVGCGEFGVGLGLEAG